MWRGNSAVDDATSRAGGAAGTFKIWWNCRNRVGHVIPDTYSENAVTHYSFPPLYVHFREMVRQEDPIKMYMQAGKIPTVPLHTLLPPRRARRARREHGTGSV